jgi:1-Cys peroxiredoxin 6
LKIFSLLSELLRTIDSLKLAEKHQLCTPSDWKPGDKCLVLPTVDQDEIDILYPKGVDTVLVPSGKHYLRMTDVED